MKNASKTMYTIGRVVNIIEIILCALMFIPGIILIAGADLIADGGEDAADAAAIRGVGIGLLIGFGIALLVLIIVIILATRASKALNNDKTERAPHIVMIIIGVFGDVLYTLGGIFGLIAENANEEPVPAEQPQAIEEQPAEKEKPEA